MLDSFEEGYLIGILTGEGHFGGDGKQAHITLRMHIKYKNIFEWLIVKFPKSKLYGPYSHGGRNYYQWMVRGEVLKNEILPVLSKHLNILDKYSKSRIFEMCDKYGLID